jgi:hypothetical protein
MTVKWIKRILAGLFGCDHHHITWPHRNRRGLDYICCLECGRELPYSLRQMSIVTIEEQIEERTSARWEEFGNAGSRVVARPS